MTNKTKNEHQMKILNALMFVESLKYSELEETCPTHDLFNYHIKELLKQEYVQKIKDRYSLTTSGRKYVAFMEEDATLQGQFKVGVFLWLTRVHNGVDQALLYKRLKHPHYGYTGLITAKMKVGELIGDTIQRELKEEVDIKAIKWNILGTMRVIFRDSNGKIGNDSVHFCYVVDEYIGDPLLKSIEGEYEWRDVSKVLSLEKIFKIGMTEEVAWLQEYIKDKNSYSPKIIEIDPPGLGY